MDRTNTFQFDAGLPASGTWPMPANMSSLAAELLAVMLNHATAASPRLTELSHSIPTFAFGTSGRAAMDGVLSEVANKLFEIPFEGAPKSVRMMEAVVINDQRLGFEIGAEYAAYLRCVATPAPTALGALAGIEPLFATPDERQVMETALLLMQEIRTVVWNFAAVDAALAGREVPKADAFGLAEVRHALKLVRVTTGAGSAK